MKNYRLTKDAEKDLRDVARYTLKQWGKAMLQQYRSGLRTAFEDIGNHNIRKHPFSDNFPELLVTKYKYHFIFYLTEGAEEPVIIGVIHERRDSVKHLTVRLTP
jgi:toxin ParE1/3/4